MARRITYQYPDLNVAERLERFMTFYKIGPTEMGKVLKRERKTVATLRDGVHSLDVNDVLNLYREYGVRPEWLLLGEGLAPWEDENGKMRHVRKL